MKLENLPTARGRTGPGGMFDAVLLDLDGLRMASPLRPLLRQLHADGVHTAAVTTSRNGRLWLRVAGIEPLVTVVVDGADGARISLPAAPDPAMFLEAARRMRTHPAAIVVLGSSPAGIRAATAGGFGLVIGIEVPGNGEPPRAIDADIELATLSGLDLAGIGAPETAIAQPRLLTGPDAWTLASHGFDPAHEGLRESLFTLGNGYWATRGSQPGATNDGVHYPGTYFAGIYNRLVTVVDSVPREDEHLVNAPDWTYLTVARTGAPAYSARSAFLQEHSQRLDLRRGLFEVDDNYADGEGRTTAVSSRRLQSQADPRLAAMETRIVAGNWSGSISILSAINTSVTNGNATVDSMLAKTHLQPARAVPAGPDTVIVDVQTNQSGLAIAMAARTRVFDQNGGPVVHSSRFVSVDGLSGIEITCMLTAGEPIIIEKTVAASTSRDSAISRPSLDAAARLERAPDFAALLARHTHAWGALWSRFGVKLPAETPAALAMNLNTFHVLQSVPVNAEIDAGIPARGLHGEGYRGHIFWDEMFVYPMLTLRRPELTRQLLMYRYRRLDQARAAATAAGYGGAMFPWQSGSSGREETPNQLFNILDGRWMPDHSHLQVHVGLAVAYSVWQYYQVTADDGFLARYGAEILAEVSRYFVSRASYDQSSDRFDIAGVMGPDEFHDAYPDSVELGIRNNTYTNVLASWVLARTADALKIVKSLDLQDAAAPWLPGQEEMRHWCHVGQRLRLHFHADGIISQFDGYEDLSEFDWETYRAKYGNIGRLDLILQAEADTTNRYQISKQADVLMLFYLFSAEELRSLFEHLGYALPPELVRRTVGYFLARTSHGSTLSRLAHSWVLARSDREKSWSLFSQALECDMSDAQGGTTREGVHLGAMAGTVDMAIRCYGGVETRQDELRIHPRLPAELPRIAFQISYRGQPIDIELDHDRAVLRLHPGSARPIHVHVEGIRKTLHPGAVFETPLRK
ncbi:glycosyl hydrolase family 65 protein [Arthrobacter sp. AQ5-05]|uniref:glycosyl hydrolase family 65 protein n=1 Tax=Arthrobacter sp. AQ5-05 TaxID=2184581 RepID=UPI001C65FC2C|nr:glycosyl hydrolase family 65 protein [Arthrobacter sp. AQ5-05]